MKMIENWNIQKKKEKYEKLKLDFFKIIHSTQQSFNKKCLKCGVFPIKGILYECSECKGYFLCEKCEEKNYIDKIHQHNFIKIRKNISKYEIVETKTKTNLKIIIEDNEQNPKELFQKKIQNKNNFTSNSEQQNIEINNEYNYNITENKDITLYKSHKTEINPFQSINKEFSFYCKIPQFIISKNEINKIISFTINNNGKNTWIENKTYLVFKENEYFSCNKTKLPPLKQNEKIDLEIPIRNKKDFKTGKYELIFYFEIDNKSYGNPIIIKVEFN